MCAFCLDENRFDLLQASDSLLFVDLLYFGSANARTTTHLYCVNLELGNKQAAFRL